MRISAILLLSICLLAGTAVNGKALKKKQVPKAVKAAFRTKCPHTKSKWQLETKMYEAHFKKDKQNQHVAFDSTGTWVYSETEIAKDKVPAAVMQALAQAEYSKWDIAETDKVVMPNYEELYRVKYRKNSTQINTLLLPNGNMLKKTQGNVGK